ncbi:MAG TPA: hypothetical protein VIT38_11095 [Allosphingosinicella sp.]
MLFLFALAGCGEPATINRTAEGSTTPPYVRPTSDPSLLGETVTPVVIGSGGPSFDACNAAGTIRRRAAGSAPVPVRAAPYEAAARIDALAGDAHFFICSRSQDEAWFGIVYDEGGQASARCGVSAPVPERRDYQGPCAAGWVSSALVRLASNASRVASSAAPQQ